MPENEPNTYHVLRELLFTFSSLLAWDVESCHVAHDRSRSGGLYPPSPQVAFHGFEARMQRVWLQAFRKAAARGCVAKRPGTNKEPQNNVHMYMHTNEQIEGCMYVCTYVCMYVCFPELGVSLRESLS